MASLTERDVASLVQAAMDAARAASDAVVALRDQQANRSSAAGGFQGASKVVRQPEPFGSECHEDDLAKWQDFDVSFKTWLFYGNKHFETDLHRVEVTHAETPISSADGEPREVKDRCNQLYSILTGLLKGKPLRLLRQVSNRNGFEVWRQLCQLFMPGLEAVQFQFSCLDGCSEFHYKRQNLAGPGVGPRTHACRIYSR